MSHLRGRKPSDPHHLRHLQPRALGRKASDEIRRAADLLFDGAGKLGRSAASDASRLIRGRPEALSGQAIRSELDLLEAGAQFDAPELLDFGVGSGISSGLLGDADVDGVVSPKRRSICPACGMRVINYCPMD